MRAEIGDLEASFPKASDSPFMILTCPECATGYFVPDDKIRPRGRAVRCANCGARWTAYPDSAPSPDSSDSPEPSEPPPPEAAEALEDAEPAPAAEEPAALIADDLPKAFRTRAEEERRLR